MYRKLWLQKKKSEAVRRYNELFAPIYDKNWGAVIDETHRSHVVRLVEKLAAGARVLDAACGTGKYLPLLQQKGLQVICVDQSRVMLDNLKEKFPEQVVYQQTLQSLKLDTIFDAVVCVDAMEDIPPEDWCLVLDNFWEHLKPGGLLYLTVEKTDPRVIKRAFAQAQKQRLPVVFGEVALEGYHYYPSEFQVRKWLREASFTVIDQSVGDGYWHLLCRRIGDE